MEQVPPDAVVFSGRDFRLAQDGELIVLPGLPEFKTELRTGRFAATVAKHSGRFARYVLGSQNHDAIGFVYADRPVPDPDTMFDSFAQDPFLIEIPTSLHPAINPESLLPLPTAGCIESKDNEAGFLVVIPVSVDQAHYDLVRHLTTS